MEPLLSVKNLVKRFGGLTAVNHVSLDIFPGEVIGLVGDNGAGKSTLIKMVSGVYHPNEGEIYFEGKPVSFANPAQARDMGIETIYQDLALAGNLSMSANIFLGRERKKRYLGGVVRVLDEKFMLQESEKLLGTLDVHIPSVHANIDKLSGGQRQAVAIARALYWNARLLIMDEPTRGIDVGTKAEIQKLVLSLAEEGMSCVFISSELEEVLRTSHRILVMRDRKKVAEFPGDITEDKVMQAIAGGQTETA